MVKKQPIGVVNFYLFNTSNLGGNPNISKLLIIVDLQLLKNVRVLLLIKIIMFT